MKELKEPVNIENRYGFMWWNPVKELKVDHARGFSVVDPQFVESGEGIESFCKRPRVLARGPSSPRSLVESGEGIES